MAYQLAEGYYRGSLATAGARHGDSDLVIRNSGDLCTRVLDAAY